LNKQASCRCFTFQEFVIPSIAATATEGPPILPPIPQLPSFSAE
jgi:hypothetical protein